ncbi:hypothetical protein AMTRI_Chr03g45600 [Amborella trichopoda]|uniref:Uncharacterized protein n=1 Tax=Amborella trichopoda TaxID=13333 RepID=W1NZS0_AMBTC|nr:hypothetical protein AMTR_s00103p00118930 [Amborella trichopoda]
MSRGSVSLWEPPPPPPPQPPHSSGTTHGSIQTLVVVLAVITIAGVLAGIFARVCGGRHLAGNSDHDYEGWIERRCRSCLDSGVALTKEKEEKKEEKKEEAPPAKEVEKGDQKV